MNKYAIISALFAGFILYGCRRETEVQVVSTETDISPDIVLSPFRPLGPSNVPLDSTVIVNFDIDADGIDDVAFEASHIEAWDCNPQSWTTTDQIYEAGIRPLNTDIEFYQVSGGQIGLIVREENESWSNGPESREWKSEYSEFYCTWYCTHFLQYDGDLIDKDIYFMFRIPSSDGFDYGWFHVQIDTNLAAPMTVRILEYAVEDDMPLTAG